MESISHPLSKPFQTTATPDLALKEKGKPAEPTSMSVATIFILSNSK